MDFGTLGDYFEIVLSKRLTGTDIDRGISHGHELGGFAKLRPFLGDEHRDVPAHYIYLDDETSITASKWTTWYDSRAGKAHRGPEFRLYYPDVPPVNMARPGDLTLACLTHDCQILFIFVQEGCQREMDVEWLFGLDGMPGPFRPARDMARRIDAFGAEILRLLGLEVETPTSMDRFVDEMLDLWPDKFPAGRDFSRFARYATGIDERDDPDTALVEYYNTQTTLFMAYEKYEHERRLGPLVTNVCNPDYDEILSVAMSIFQRRRSAAGHALVGRSTNIWAVRAGLPRRIRAGHAEGVLDVLRGGRGAKASGRACGTPSYLWNGPLEYHLEALFEARGIQFTSQGLTEGKEKPDFLFPSVEAYHNPSFPAEGLTLLGAKTTAKDRWRQVLQEGNRIPHKHLITLEPAISVNQTNEMKKRRLQLVVPSPIHASYMPVQQQWLWTVAGFCDYVLEKQCLLQPR